MIKHFLLNYVLQYHYYVYIAELYLYEIIINCCCIESIYIYVLYFQFKKMCLNNYVCTYEDLFFL